MSHPEKVVIVAGVDGSSVSRRAACWAATEALRRDAVLRLVTAITPPAGGEYPAPLLVRPVVTETLRRQARQLLDRIADVLERGNPGLRVECASHAGSPAAVLVEESRHAVMTVLGSRSVGQIFHTVFGSVAAQVASHGHGCVVVVGAPSPEIPPATAGPVVVGVDGSAQAQAAIAFAFQEADLRGSPLLVVHVGNRGPLDHGASHRWNSTAPAAGHQDGFRLADDLRALSARYPTVPVRQSVLHGRPAGTLRRYVTAIDQDRAQLLVLGSRGHHGIARLLGSTSLSLIGSAGCPVAVVRDAHITTAA